MSASPPTPASRLLSSPMASSSATTPEKPAGLRSRHGSPPTTRPSSPPTPPPPPAAPLQTLALRVSSGVLSLLFLGSIVLGAFVQTIPSVLRRSRDSSRPFIAIERARAQQRAEEYAAWRSARVDEESGGEAVPSPEDELQCDIGYYARRVGLECETFTVETEDGFLLEMQHIWDPADPPYYAESEKTTPGLLAATTDGQRRPNGRPGRRRYPLLLIHGLLQSAGAFCVNDSSSLAFMLCRAGYDIFLANSRCGMSPRHTVYQLHQAELWDWSISDLATRDLPAFISTVLSLTAFDKLAVVAHSQGTTLTFLALATHHRPDLGDKISVFCALAPAVYAGPLIDTPPFPLLRRLPAPLFTAVFGTLSFIPLMMTMHSMLPAALYGDLGYRVFHHLFKWTDTRWDRGLRRRFFRFAPVHVSARIMAWWIGGAGFAAERQCMGDVQGPWFDGRFPKLAVWVAGADRLVDGCRLLRRFEEGEEPHVQVVHQVVIEGYEHLDVVWAVDAEERVGREVRDVVWRCIEDEVRKEVVPIVCE